MTFTARIESDGPYARLDEQGRYRVRAAFDESTTDYAQASPPLRRMQPLAGSGQEPGEGFHFPLTDGAEVLMGCLNNDPDRPILMGATPTADAPGPVTAANRTQNVLRTAAGNELTLEDELEREAITLQTWGGANILHLDMTAQANRIRLAAEHGALAVNAGTLMRIQAKEDLIERVGADRVQVVEGASRTETQNAEIHHQAKTDITHRATRRIDLTAGKNAELVAGKHLVVNARNNAKVTVRGKGGTVIAVQGGNLTFQAARDIRITGKGGGDITFEQSGAGFRIDTAGNVHLYGQNIALGGDGGVSFGGPVNWNIGSPGMPGEAGLGAPKAAGTIPTLSDELDSRIDHLAWSRQAAGVGERVELQFNVRGFAGGETLSVQVHATGPGLDDVPVATLSTTLEDGEGPVTIPWTVQGGVFGEDRLSLHLPEREASRPLQYRFTVADDSGQTRPSPPLALHCQVTVELTDTVDRPLPNGTEVCLRSHDGRRHRRRIHDGRCTLDDIPLGPWQMEMAGEIVTTALGEREQDHAPHCDSAWLVPGTVAARREARLRLLPPPVILNLREDAPGPRARLSDAELDYFRRNGSNAVVFIHGFNVAWGACGRHLRNVTVRRQGRRTQVELDEADTPATVLRTPDTLAERFPDARSPEARARLSARDLNGREAHKWFVCMEYELNRAALGRELAGEDWKHYTRIIHVAWSGDVSAVNYIEAEHTAARAGRQLPLLLRQLQDAGIRTNLLAHSLGNRVGLVALHEQGKVGRRHLVEHFFLWQPAVPDTALSNDPDADTSLLHNWRLTHAHEGAKRFVVLYSQEDNVLGPYANRPDYPDLPGTAADELLEIADTPSGKEDMTPGQDGKTQWLSEVWPNAVLGMSAYEFATRIQGAPLLDSLGRLLQWARGNQATLQHPWREPGNREIYERRLAEVRAEYEQRLEALYRRNPALRRTPTPAEEKAVETLLSLAAHRTAPYRKVRPVRPAMGYVGIEEAVKIDVHTRTLFQDGKIAPVNQTPWLKSHSGMQEPTGELRTEVYEKVILARIKKDGGGFGSF